MTPQSVELPRHFPLQRQLPATAGAPPPRMMVVCAHPLPSDEETHLRAVMCGFLSRAAVHYTSSESSARGLRWGSVPYHLTCEAAEQRHALLPARPPEAPARALGVWLLLDPRPSGARVRALRETDYLADLAKPLLDAFATLAGCGALVSDVNAKAECNAERARFSVACGSDAWSVLQAQEWGFARAGDMADAAACAGDAALMITWTGGAPARRAARLLPLPLDRMHLASGGRVTVAGAREGALGEVGVLGCARDATFATLAELLYRALQDEASHPGALDLGVAVPTRPDLDSLRAEHLRAGVSWEDVLALASRRFAAFRQKRAAIFRAVSADRARGAQAEASLVNTGIWLRLYPWERLVAARDRAFHSPSNEEDRDNQTVRATHLFWDPECCPALLLSYDRKTKAVVQFMDQAAPYMGVLADSTVQALGLHVAALFREPVSMAPHASTFAYPQNMRLQPGTLFANGGVIMAAVCKVLPLENALLGRNADGGFLAPLRGFCVQQLPQASLLPLEAECRQHCEAALAQLYEFGCAAAKALNDPSSDLRIMCSSSTWKRFEFQRTRDAPTTITEYLKLLDSAVERDLRPGPAEQQRLSRGGPNLEPAAKRLCRALSQHGGTVRDLAGVTGNSGAALLLRALPRLCADDTGLDEVMRLAAACVTDFATHGATGAEVNALRALRSVREQLR